MSSDFLSQLWQKHPQDLKKKKKKKTFSRFFLFLEKQHFQTPKQETCFTCRTEKKTTPFYVFFCSRTCTPIYLSGPPGVAISCLHLIYRTFHTLWCASQACNSHTFSWPYHTCTSKIALAASKIPYHVQNFDSYVQMYSWIGTTIFTRTHTMHTGI